MSLPTPILFLVFNRPDTTMRVFEQIRAAAPQRLYIAADGPRADRPNEKAITEQVRAVAELVDWPCTVFTRFRDQNLGCKIAIYDAISWFFENEEAGIILEDDCLPNQDFFTFCTDLLVRYQQDERVFMISGNQFLPQNQALTSDYSTSAFTFIWGWATWRRAWQHMDLQMAGLTNWEEKPNLFADVLPDAFARRYFLHKWQEVAKGKINTWDYQWLFAAMKNRAWCIVPRVNLVENIGFGVEATHTSETKSGMPALALPAPIKHPEVLRGPTAVENQTTFYKAYKKYWPLRIFILRRAITKIFTYK